MKILAATLLCASAALALDDKTQVERAKPAVTGKVVFDGKRPEPKLLPATAEQAKGCCPADKSVDAKDPRLLIDEHGAIANVLVTVSVPDQKCEPSKMPIVVDQHLCVFEPHCTIVPAGSKVVFKNSDTVNHNVRVTSLKNDSSNDTVAPGAQKEYVFANVDKITIGCDFHPWMSSVLLVVDTPFAALTKADGSFALEGLKPGTYKVKVWHETLGRSEAELVVKDDGTSAPLEIKLAEKKPK
jgi:plastocyanin